MKLKLVCIYIILLFSLNACSNGGAYDTGSIEGTIYDLSDGLPVAGALITIGGNALLTDQGGNYYSSEINAGRQTISAVYTGYDLFSGTVTIQKDTAITYNINLEWSDTVTFDTFPVAHYRLNKITPDNYVIDSSENSVDGAVAGDTSIVEGPGGGLLYAVRFDGDGDYIECSPNPAITNDTMTVGFWAKFDNAQAYTLSFTNTIDTVSYGFRLIFHNNKVAINYFHSGTSVYVQLSEDKTLPEGEWCHIAIVIDKASGDFGMVKPYINGKHISVRDHHLEGDINGLADCSLFLGASNSYAYWRGDLADVRIYNEVLTAEEISELYQLADE